MSKVRKYIQDHTKKCSNRNNDYGHIDRSEELYIPWLTPDEARKAVEIAREELIEKVCHFLDGYAFIPTYVINDLKQAMKDE